MAELANDLAHRLAPRIIPHLHVLACFLAKSTVASLSWLSPI